MRVSGVDACGAAGTPAPRDGRSRPARRAPGRRGGHPAGAAGERPVGDAILVLP
ncbi:hypothetical protein OHA59_19325 [Streptomyces sp. NBC_01589]|uniref:hypothetical protein n=1 Tax=Streptomyces sp. NBC_01589 TaxID=2975886 RepID=UPI003863F39B